MGYFSLFNILHFILCTLYIFVVSVEQIFKQFIIDVVSIKKMFFLVFGIEFYVFKLHSFINQSINLLELLNFKICFKSCNNRTHKHSSNSHEKLDSLPCSICHIPYNEHSVPFSMNMKYCSTCK